MPLRVLASDSASHLSSTLVDSRFHGADAVKFVQLTRAGVPNFGRFQVGPAAWMHFVGGASSASLPTPLNSRFYRWTAELGFGASPQRCASCALATSSTSNSQSQVNPPLSPKIPAPSAECGRGSAAKSRKSGRRRAQNEGMCKASPCPESGAVSECKIIMLPVHCPRLYFTGLSGCAGFDGIRFRALHLLRCQLQVTGHLLAQAALSPDLVGNLGAVRCFTRWPFPAVCSKRSFFGCVHEGASEGAFACCATLGCSCFPEPPNSTGMKGRNARMSKSPIGIG